MADVTPYQISVLCYLFDNAGRVLLLHRRKRPNQGLFSPIGGKLDRASGESPTDCALREIREETGLQAKSSDVHLTGIVSEMGYENQSHWLMFLYELVGPVQVAPGPIDEGTLGWHDPAGLDRLAIPETDRQIIWPLFWKYRRNFFAVHIDCRDGIMQWGLQQPAVDATTASDEPDGSYTRL